MNPPFWAKEGLVQENTSPEKAKIANAVREIVRRHEGCVFHDEMHHAVEIIANIEVPDADLRQAIDSLIELGEINPSITNSGRMIYMWRGWLR
jgi:hypothetical protein